MLKFLKIKYVTTIIVPMCEINFPVHLWQVITHTVKVQVSLVYSLIEINNKVLFFQLKRTDIFGLIVCNQAIVYKWKNFLKVVVHMIIIAKVIKPG